MTELRPSPMPMIARSLGRPRPMGAEPANSFGFTGYG